MAETSPHPPTARSLLDVTLESVTQGELPPGVERLRYRSLVDAAADWALIRPPRRGGRWLVNLHGHGARGDQLFTRQDLRRNWWPAFDRTGAGILTPHLRGNAWMGPAALVDLHALLHWLKQVHEVREIILVGGSMGGTSCLIYAVNHPEDVAAVIALCPATDVGAYWRWCQAQQDGPVIREIAEAIAQAYGGAPREQAEPYARHNALARAERLTMPLVLVHGSADHTIPAHQSRQLAERMPAQAVFRYWEIADGDHDAPLLSCEQALAWVCDAREGRGDE